MRSRRSLSAIEAALPFIRDSATAATRARCRRRHGKILPGSRVSSRILEFGCRSATKSLTGLPLLLPCVPRHYSNGACEVVPWLASHDPAIDRRSYSFEVLAGYDGYDESVVHLRSATGFLCCLLWSSTCNNRGGVAAGRGDAPQPLPPPPPPPRFLLQLEWRMSMLCEQSGFINEALDFLVSLEEFAAAASSSSSSSSSSSPGLPALFNISLTGLHGDCSGLARRPGPRRGAAAPAGR